MEEIIDFVDGVPTQDGSPHAGFLLDFFILFRMALINLAPEEMGASRVIGNTFFLSNLEGGYLAILPMEQKMFLANENFQILEIDFKIPLSQLFKVYDSVEAVLSGPTVEVIQTSPLSEIHEGLYISLNYLAGLVILAGQEKFDPEGYLIKDGILYLKWHNKGFLAINPSSKKVSEQHYFVGKDLSPSPELFSIDVKELELIVKELEKLLVQAEVIQPGEF